MKRSAHREKTTPSVPRFYLQANEDGDMQVAKCFSLEFLMTNPNQQCRQLLKVLSALTWVDEWQLDNLANLTNLVAETT